MNKHLHVIVTLIGGSSFSGFLCLRLMTLYHLSWAATFEKFLAVHIWLFFGLISDQLLIALIILSFFIVGMFAYLIWSNIIMKFFSVLTIILWYLIGITIVFGTVT